MFKFYNSIVPNKVHVGCHFSSNNYAYRDAYSALKCRAFYSFDAISDCVLNIFSSRIHTKVKYFVTSESTACAECCYIA